MDLAPARPIGLGSIHRASVVVEVPHEFAKYEALQPQSKVERFRIVLDSEPEEFEDCVGYDCVTSNGIHRTVYLRSTPPAGVDRLEVRGVVEVIDHPAAVYGATFFAGFREHRLREVGGGG